jgi:hypothetical protein
MFRYVGLPCPNDDCKTFIIWKELSPTDLTPTVRVLDIVSGNCPRCKHAYFLTAGELIEIKSENRPANDPPALPAR